MNKRVFHLINDRIRNNVVAMLSIMPAGTIVEFREPTRSGVQNSKLWAMLGDVADAKPEGREWTPETWKCAFMHVLGHQVRFCEGLDNSGPFPMGFSSSKLTVRQMADLITVIQEYGDRHGVPWSDPAIRREAA